MNEAKTLHPVPLDLAGSGGVRLRVWDYGGEGPPLIFCHCGGTLGRIWDPVIAGLAVQARLLAVDLRGHGDSDKPRGRMHYRWESFANDLLALAEPLSLGGDAAAVGHSGGAVAITIAQLSRPGLFGRIALIDAVLAPDSLFAMANTMAESARRRKDNFESRAIVRERLGDKFPFNSWSTEALDAYITHGFEARPDGRLYLKCPGEVEANWYEAGSTQSVLDRMHEFDVPALLVTGTRSYMLDHVREQHRRTPGSRLEILEDVGHFVPQEQPEQTARLLNEWLR